MKPGKFALVVTLIVLLFFYVPIFIVVLFSFNSSKSPEWTGFSLKWYEKLFTSSAHIWRTFMNSIIVGISSSFVGVILGTFGAVAMYMGSKKFKKLMWTTTYIPFIIPDIIIGVSLLVFFTTIHLRLSLFTIFIAHVTFSIPYTMMIILTRLQDFDKSIIEAAYDLGATRAIALWKVIIPIALPGIVAAFFMAFTLSIDDFVITFFVAGPSSTTLPLQIFSMVRFGISPVINAISTLLLAGTIFISVLLRKYVRYII
ncbi:spermidine/putrescine transport system permease protein [Fervidobacterium changbaicum]|uniref:ABC transporter permease n=2 Tax=Fervidobacterium TaxID=2422 RepID=A0AAI8CK81_FERIS|nr:MULTISPECIES: ABC transporter permease [Fervidobacterium]AMW32041.1 ABC transporter permease [Fervidobacterium islandicum]QAV33826.1 ABC transporter permease [Fervidobacterium changbaicum]SDH68256.1 spermidine/putrescine transport system permease protein [Fervidobacterium changbaicum]